MSVLDKFILAVPESEPPAPESADPVMPLPELAGQGFSDSELAALRMSIPASEWPETLELWLRKSAWTVICFASVEEAEQCSAALLGFLPPGRIEQVEGGATLQLDFRKLQSKN